MLNLTNHQNYIMEILINNQNHKNNNLISNNKAYKIILIKINQKIL